MYIFCRSDEVSAIRKSKIITFSITGSQIFFADIVFYQKNTTFHIKETIKNTRILQLVLSNLFKTRLQVCQLICFVLQG